MRQSTDPRHDARHSECFGVKFASLADSGGKVRSVKHLLFWAVPCMDLVKKMDDVLKGLMLSNASIECPL